MSAALTSTADGGVLTLTLTDPASGNSLAPEATRQALDAALRDWADDAGLRALVLTGQGDFSVGGSPSALGVLDEAGARAFLGEQVTRVERLVRTPKIAIAAVEGRAIGGGFGLALACDLVVAARDATLWPIAAAVGALPDSLLLWSLAARVGPHVAKRMFLLAEPLTGEQAFEARLVDRLVEPGEALSAARSLAQTIAAGAPLAQAAIKRAYTAWPDASAAREAMLGDGARLIASADFREGGRAISSGETPRFEGR